jgi:hypothetical protein
VFKALEGDHPVGFALGFIPASAITDWMLNVEGERDRVELARAVRMVRAIDAEFLAAERARAKS